MYKHTIKQHYFSLFLVLWPLGITNLKREFETFLTLNKTKGDLLQMKQRISKVLFVSQTAIIAAIYVVITVLFSYISFGVFQVRISEALTLLPVLTPAAIPGLFIGAFLGNILGTGNVIDMVFGSLATLIAAILTYRIRCKSRWLAPLPPILVNALIIPFVIRYGYGVPVPIPILMLTVGAGQVIACGVLGQLLLKALEKHKNYINFGYFEPK